MDSLKLYHERLKLKGATFTLIEHEHALVAEVYKVRQADKEYILKICPDERHFRREVLFLNLLSEKLPVPHVIDVVEPKAILMEYLPGNVMQLEDVDKNLAFECGRLLGHLHLNRCEGYGDLIKIGLSEDPSNHFTDKFKEGLNECSHVLAQELLENCLKFYQEHIGLLSNVDGPRIVHRDFRPGNLMLHEGKIQGIIDWSSARSGFAEEDFCAEWPQWDSFIAGYETVRPVPDLTRLMPLLKLSKAVASVGFAIRRGTWNNKDQLFYERNLKTMKSIVLSQ